LFGAEQRRPLQLTPQIAFEIECFVLREFENVFRQLHPRLPHRQLLKPFVSHFSNLQSQISNSSSSSFLAISFFQISNFQHSHPTGVKKKLERFV
jgi:hypothetical protein